MLPVFNETRIDQHRVDSLHGQRRLIDRSTAWAGEHGASQGRPVRFQNGHVARHRVAGHLQAHLLTRGTAERTSRVLPGSGDRDRARAADRNRARENRGEVHGHAARVVVRGSTRITYRPSPGKGEESIVLPLDANESRRDDGCSIDPQQRYIAPRDGHVDHPEADTLPHAAIERQAGGLPWCAEGHRHRSAVDADWDRYVCGDEDVGGHSPAAGCGDGDRPGGRPGRHASRDGRRCRAADRGLRRIEREFIERGIRIEIRSGNRDKCAWGANVWSEARDRRGPGRCRHGEGLNAVGTARWHRHPDRARRCQRPGR